MMIKPVSRRSDTAAYNVMCANQSMLNLLSFAGSGNANPAFLAKTEARFNQDIAQNSLMYKLSLAQEARLQKMQEENIERSFSTFA